MIIHCPKCSYSRKPTDVAPATECPACGIVFEKYLARSTSKALPAGPQRGTANSTRQSSTSDSNVAKRSVTSCPACGGTVAFGANTCPHCGKSKPAPEPPTKVTKLHLALAGVFLIIMFSFISQGGPPLTADEVTKICANEVGLDVNSSQAMTIQHIRAIDVCLNRHGIKTRP